MKKQPFHRRLGFAWRGILHAFRVEPGFRFQVLAAVAVIVVLGVSHAPPIWWGIAALAIAAVTAAEVFNTAIEHLADHLHPQQHDRIRIVKDCAAGAVLLASIGAVGVAVAFAIAVLL